MMSSLDGRIKQNNWSIRNPAKIFEDTAKKVKADAWIVGRTTMQEFSGKAPRAPRSGMPAVKTKGDFVAKHGGKSFAVAIDPSGRCRWDTDNVDSDHVIEVLTKKVSLAYLTDLRAANVSYIFAGATTLDLGVALEKLNRLFGIRRVRIDGGGTVNGSFLEGGSDRRIQPCRRASGRRHDRLCFDIRSRSRRNLATCHHHEAQVDSNACAAEFCGVGTGSSSAALHERPTRRPRAPSKVPTTLPDFLRGLPHSVPQWIDRHCGLMWILSSRRESHERHGRSHTGTKRQRVWSYLYGERRNAAFEDAHRDPFTRTQGATIPRRWQRPP